MDLAFTPEELAFRDEIRAWVKDHLPQDIAAKVHQAQRLWMVRQRKTPLR